MSEDVSRFLSQVKELGERRIEEDEARSRELEEQILQDRKERQARRRGETLVSSLLSLLTHAHTPPPSLPLYLSAAMLYFYAIDDYCFIAFHPIVGNRA